MDKNVEIEHKDLMFQKIYGSKEETPDIISISNLSNDHEFLCAI